MCIHFDSDFKAITQALNYFAIKNNGPINKLRALKLLYLADRYHLRKYGRPITGDTYFAMPYGPVGTLAKDIAECNSFLADHEMKYSNQYLSPSVDPYAIGSLNVLDIDPFSDSDVEALAFSWNNFHKFSRFQLAEITHAYPEWMRFKESLSKGESSREEMDYEDFFDDPDESEPSLNLVNNSDPFVEAVTTEQKECAFEIAKENSEIRKEWRK